MKEQGEISETQLVLTRVYCCDSYKFDIAAVECNARRRAYKVDAMHYTAAFGAYGRHN